MDRCFVACVKNDYRALFLENSRLYAYPMKPDLPAKNEFIILDSGAYGLSQKKQEIDAEYMFKLANYYKIYNASNQFPVLAIAPDVYLNPHKTIQNYQFWLKYINQPIVPVIQFSQKARLDLISALKQVDIYFKSNPIIAISNPGLRGSQAKALVYVIKYMRDKGVEWVHCLGAGWNALDCRDWFKIGFDSIDSISFYTDAEKKIEWKPVSYSTGKTNKNIKDIVLCNYNIANYVAKT